MGHFDFLQIPLKSKANHSFFHWAPGDISTPVELFILRLESEAVFVYKIQYNLFTV